MRESGFQVGLAVEGAPMGQRLGQQLGAREAVADPQWIAMKKRLKRIACGHFHGSSQPAADGSCEKKMNSARPTRFSAGTYQPCARSPLAPSMSRTISAARLSSESSRLSPIMKKLPAGTTNSGVLSAGPLSLVSRIS